MNILSELLVKSLTLISKRSKIFIYSLPIFIYMLPGNFNYRKVSLAGPILDIGGIGSFFRALFLENYN